MVNKYLTREPRILNGDDSLFNKYRRENWIFLRMKLDPYLIPFTKINSKWMKDFKMRPEAIKLLEENIRKKLLDIGLGNNFLDMTSKAQATKSKINKWGYITKKLPYSKRNNQKVKGQPTEWGKVFANCIFDKGLISKIYKELIQLNSIKSK